jgi:hypothetical protein
LSVATYYVDEAGDGVLFGPKGRDRLKDEGAAQLFMLGMVRCACDAGVSETLARLRTEVLANPLYASIPWLYSAVMNDMILDLSPRFGAKWH